MRINAVHLHNYRTHENLSVQFKARFSVVVGVNGSGKTSLLKGLCDALTGLTDFIPIAHSYSALRERDVAHLSVRANEGRFRFEPQFPVVVKAEGEAFGLRCEWKVIKHDQITHARLDGASPGAVMQAPFLPDMPVIAAQREQTFPLVAFYRANREWNQPRPTEMQAATERNSRTDAYSNWADASLDASALQGWVIAKCLERFQTSSETGISFDRIVDDELALVNRALGMAVEHLAGLRYDLKQKSLLVDWRGVDDTTSSISFENLSHGQRAVIGLVADIARRVCILNPQLGLSATEKTSGVVLIDELDMHLHPRWQRILTSGLKNAFPSMQFVVASHSPQVLGELQPDEIILLKPGETTHPQVSYGLSSSQILEEIMGADARTAEVDRRLTSLFEALERNQIEQARGEIEKLRREVPGIPELAGAEALLRRKEVLGR